MKTIIIFTAIILISLCSAWTHAGECKDFIEVLSAKEWAREMGKTEAWVVANHRIDLWTKGREHVVGNLLPGSRALIIISAPEQYYVQSPLDGSKGWISKIQVKRVLKQDTKTFEKCE